MPLGVAHRVHGQQARMRRPPTALALVTAAAVLLMHAGAHADVQRPPPAPARAPAAPPAKVPGAVGNVRPATSGGARSTPPGAAARTPAATGFRYLRLDARGELVVELPEDPERLYRLAATKQGQAAVVEEMGREFLGALDQEAADRTTRRYEKVVGDLREFVAKSPDRGRVERALQVVGRYVQGGEQTDPFAAKGKTPGFYKDFNAALRGSLSMEDFRLRHPEKAAFLFGEMLPAYESLPGKVKGIVFRGTSLSAEEADLLATGARRTFKQLAPMSTSMSLGDACTFLGKNPKTVPTMMVIRSKTGKLVSWKDSPFAFEEEVLLMGREGLELEVQAAFMAPAPRAGDGEREILYLFLDEKVGRAAAPETP